MAISQSKLVAGTELQVKQALADWALAEPNCHLVPCIFDRHAVECFEFSALAAFRPVEMTAYLAMDDTLLNFSRRFAFDHLDEMGFEMPALVHPQSVIDPRIVLGKNCGVGQGALVAAQAELGWNVVLGSGAAIHYGCKIGNHVTIGEGARIGSGCWIGDCVTIGAYVTLREGSVVGEQSYITKPDSYCGHYTEGTFLIDEFSAKILR